MYCNEIGYVGQKLHLPEYCMHLEMTWIMQIVCLAASLISTAEYSCQSYES